MIKEKEKLLIKCTLNALPASGELRRLLIIFAKSLDPDQAQQNVGLILIKLIVFLEEFFEKVNFEKND